MRRKELSFKELSQNQQEMVRALMSEIQHGRADFTPDDIAREFRIKKSSMAAIKAWATMRSKQGRQKKHK